MADEPIVDAAADIVRDKAAATSEANVQALLDTYEPGENPKTRILVWDHRVISMGHSANKAVCVAISSAMQTTAAIGRALHTVNRVELFRNTHNEPAYDIQFKTGQRSRRMVAALVASLAGIARSAEKDHPGSAMELCDQRRNIPVAIAFENADR